MRTTKGCLILRGDTYHACWYHAGKRYQYSTKCTVKKEAQKVLDDLIAPFTASTDAALQESIAGRVDGRKAEAERLTDERTPALRIVDTWSAFVASPTRPDSGERTMEGYETHWTIFRDWLKRVHPDCEHLRDVTPDMADAYARELAGEKKSASTFNQKRNLLHLLWRCLAKEGRLTCNPWEGIAPRKLTALAFRKRPISTEQFQALLAVVEGDVDLRDLITLLAWTGLRMADGVCLRWGAADFKNGILTVTPRKTERRQGKQVHIPMFPAVRELLNRRQAGHVLNPAAAVFPDFCEMYQHDPSALSKRITAAFEKAGMASTEKRAGRKKGVNVYGAHSLRHFFVTAAAAAGLPAPVIKSITGHATDTMMEHYQHISADYAGEIAKRITGTDTKALPAPVSDVDGIRAKMKELAEKLTVKNVKETRAALLALAEQKGVAA